MATGLATGAELSMVCPVESSVPRFTSGTGDEDIHSDMPRALASWINVVAAYADAAALRLPLVIDALSTNSQCVVTGLPNLSRTIGNASGITRFLDWSEGAWTIYVDLDVREDEKLPEPGELEERPAHARLARELREMTGLSAEMLGAALGVTREQYQRWLRGSPISDARHGQLIYLHTMAFDVLRRLGPAASTVWWRTPIADRGTPADMLAQRLGDSLLVFIGQIDDSQPVVGGVLQSLPVQEPLDLDDYKDDGDDEPWSPYELDA